MMLKIFFWNIWLRFTFWFKIKFHGKKIEYYKKWDKKKDGWSLTFADEFNKGELNLDVWRTDAYYGMRFHPESITDRNEAPTQWLRDNCFEHTSGTLLQKAVKQNKLIRHEGKEYNIPYRVGQIDSSNYFMQTHGYFEIRSKMPSSNGMWPAFWLASVLSWPPEIDIYEVYTGKKNGSSTITNNVHWGQAKKKKMSPKGFRAFDLSKRFCIYGCDWNEKTIKFYFQDKLIRVIKTPKEFIHPMHIIINTAVDVDNVEGAEFPNYHEVDYVRAYKRNE